MKKSLLIFYIGTTLCNTPASATFVNAATEVGQTARQLTLTTTYYVPKLQNAINQLQGLRNIYDTTERTLNNLHGYFNIDPTALIPIQTTFDQLGGLNSTNFLGHLSNDTMGGGNNLFGDFKNQFSSGISKLLNFNSTGYGNSSFNNAKEMHSSMQDLRLKDSLSYVSGREDREARFQNWQKEKAEYDKKITGPSGPKSVGEAATEQLKAASETNGHLGNANALAAKAIEKRDQAVIAEATKEAAIAEDEKNLQGTKTQAMTETLNNNFENLNQ
jgi:hypothetical protein